jgi:hypothetical protein
MACAIVVTACAAQTHKPMAPTPSSSVPRAAEPAAQPTVASHDEPPVEREPPTSKRSKR